MHFPTELLKDDRVLCFGEVLFDEYGTSKVLAGAPLNVATTAAALGMRSSIVSSVNKDDYGLISEEIKRRGVHPFISSSDRPIGAARVSVVRGQPTFTIEDDSAWDTISLDCADLPMSGFLYFGTLCQRSPVSRRSLQNLLHAHQGLRVYDVNLRSGIPDAISLVERSALAADIIKANEDEARFMMDVFGCSGLAGLVHKTGARMIFVTMGEKGARLCTSTSDMCVQAPQVDAINATGCGDAFTAAVIQGISSGWSDIEILDLAVKVGSKVASMELSFLVKDQNVKRAGKFLTE